MVTFISVFLGLVLGVQPVEWTVGADVAAVELRLDGHSVGRLNGPPWVMACDFGSELAPHELEAVAYDSQGRELSRAVQWLNVPQPRSRAELVLMDDEVPRRAGIVWNSADALQPDEWQIRFDGRPLEVADPSSFVLPTYNDEQMHFLQAELRFGRSWARTERVLGGRAGDQIDTALTAFSVHVKHGGAPTVAELQGELSRNGEPLEVVSVEQAGSDIVVVQEATPWLWGQLNRLRSQSLDTRNRSFMANRLTSGLKDNDRLRVVLPVAERVDGAAMDQFHISFDFAGLGSGPTSIGAQNRSVALPTAQGLLATLPYPAEGALRDDAPRRVAEAVAVAGQVASAGGRTRAVVLIKDPRTEDSSSLDPFSVRRYLDRLQVPLKVWSPEVPNGAGSDPWGEVWEISTSRRLQRAVLDLRESLDAQWLVWVQGRHLAHEIELSPTLSSRLSPAVSDSKESSSEVSNWEFGEARSDGLEPWIESAGPDAARRQALAQTNPGTEKNPGEPMPSISQADPIRDPQSSEAAELDVSVGPEHATLVEAVEVRLVNVQAVVTAKDGSRIRDLNAADFELRVDGEPVELSHFVPPPAPAGDRAAAVGVGEPLDKPSASAEEAVRWVVFFDVTKLGVSGRREILQTLRNLVDGDELRQETMLVTYDRSLKIQLPFTSDPASFLAVLDRIESGELLRSPEIDHRTRLANEMPHVEDAILSAVDPLAVRMALADRDALLARLNAVARSEAADNRSSIHALRTLTTGLAGLEGRKVLLYVGEGLELTPVQELFEEAMETLQLSGLEMANLRAEGEALHTHREFESLMDEVHGAGVTYYSLTPKTRARLDVVSRANISSTRPGAQGRLPSARQELVKDAVCLLASQSGGLCQVGGSQPELLLEQALGDATAAYTLAFTPPHPADGALHSLDIEVARPDLKVRHARSYSDRGPAGQIHHRLSAALYFQSEDNPLSLDLAVGEFGAASSEGLTLVPMSITVPVERLGLMPSAGRKLGAKARLLVTTRHESGAATGVQEYPIAFQLPAERLRQPQPLAYSHKLNLMLAPGRHTVAIGLWDDVSDLGSFMSREVTVPGSS